MAMEDEHITRPADAADQRRLARDLLESLGKLRHDRMPRVSRRAEQEFDRKAHFRFDGEQIGPPRDCLLEPREKLPIYRFKLFARHALPVKFYAEARRKRDRLFHSHPPPWILVTQTGTGS